MKIRYAFCLFVMGCLPVASIAQMSAGQSDPQAISIFQGSLAAMVKTTAVADVVLQGTVRRIAGSDDETGTGIFKGLGAGASNITLNFPSGQRAEVCNFTAAMPAGDWSDAGGVSHGIAYHNLLNDPNWFFPAFAIARRLSNSGYTATYVGHEIHNSQAVEHVSVSQASPGPVPAGAPSFQHLTQVDFFFDSATLLPAAIAFIIHPDSDASTDISMEIQLSDYRLINGVQVPHRIQKFLNNGLILDFQVGSVVLNSGLQASAFNAQ